VIPHRILLALAQSLLALLLMAGAAQAKPCLFEARDRIESGESTLNLSGAVIAPLEDTSLSLQAAPSGGDDDPGSVLPGAAPTIVLDHARLIRISCVSYPNAPPSHRPCAAPPTGPPLV
jgi:hypothetical protein